MVCDEYDDNGTAIGSATACDLSLNQHLHKITANANRVLGLVKRTFRDLRDIRDL